MISALFPAVPEVQSHEAVPRSTCDAVPEETDPKRPLSNRGRVEVQRLAEFLADVGVQASIILHSGKARAEQTAELLARFVGTGRRPEKTPGIAPHDSAPAFASTVNTWTTDTLVVGHQPFMGKLVSQLLIGNEAGMSTAFYPGSVVCLEREEGGGWQLAWMIRPEILVEREAADP
jgi:phosphohistidine phosphatase